MKTFKIIVYFKLGVREIQGIFPSKQKAKRWIENIFKQEDIRYQKIKVYVR